MAEMSWRDLTRAIAREHGKENLTDDEVDLVLWEKTAYPFARIAYTAVQIDDYFSDPAKVDREIEEAWGG